MKLYYLPGTCSLAIHIILEWIGEPYEAVAVTRERTRTPEYLKMNPVGAVPALGIGGRVLTQNSAIQKYLIEKYPQEAVRREHAERSRRGQGAGR